MVVIVISRCLGCRRRCLRRLKLFFFFFFYFLLFRSLLLLLLLFFTLFFQLIVSNITTMYLLCVHVCVCIEQNRYVNNNVLDGRCLVCMHSHSCMVHVLKERKPNFENRSSYGPCFSIFFSLVVVFFSFFFFCVFCVGLFSPYLYYIFLFPLQLDTNLFNLTHPQNDRFV